VPVFVGVLLLPVMAVALGLLNDLGIWVVAVLGGATLGALVALAGVGLISASRSLRRHEQEHLTDAVTALPSSDRMLRDLAAVLADRRQPRAVLSLYVLDGLKRYNDAYGRACGDALLSWLGHKLADAVGEGGIVYRMRGGEFAVLAHGDDEATAAVRHSAAAALREAGEGFVICPAVGEAVLPEEALTVSEALKLIDHRAHAHLQATKGEAEHQPPADVIDAARPPASEYDIAALALAVGHQLDIAPAALEDLAAAANLRDIGNMAIPTVVLGHTEQLPEDEWRFIQLHTLVGERLLATNFNMEEVGRVVRSSHERWDGTGYPDGLSGEAIPLELRIIACCDTWNAMRTDRPYRKALSYEVGRAELISASGTQLDPKLIDALLELVAAEAPAPRLVSPDGAGAPQPRLEYGFARQAC